MSTSRARLAPARSELEQLWRRTFDAYADYSRAVGRLTADYVRAIASTAREVRSGSAAPSATIPRAPRRSTTTMALEAAAGSTAVGMFVVENGGPSTVSGALEVPSLANTDGQQVKPQIAFEPDRVTLEPDEQTVVQASVKIDRSLRPGVDYRGVIQVPGPPGTRIPIVVRRLPSPASGRQA
jgi:hypothetical protein